MSPPVSRSISTSRPQAIEWILFAPPLTVALVLSLLFVLPVNGSVPPDTKDCVTAAVRQIFAERNGGTVTLDGVLDEDIWARAAVAPLVQNEPDNGECPRQHTDWWVAYDDEALYVAARMWDAAPESIGCCLGRRDSRPESDWVYLNLDTFNDDRNGYTFSLNPAGSIDDGVLYNDGWNDYSWDGIWD